MANHCYNKLEIVGNKEQLDLFLKEAKSEKESLSFNSFIPISDEDPEWYDKRWEQWGTKWDPFDIKMETIADNWMVFHFYTAYNPPVKWLEFVDKKFDKLNFILYYHEPLTYLAGYIVSENKNAFDEPKINENLNTTDEKDIENIDKAFEEALKDGK